MSITIKQIFSNNNILTGSSSTLVVTRDMVRNFGQPEDYVEMILADPANKVLNTIVPFSNYTIPGIFQPKVDPATIQELIFDPSTDLKNLGIQSGDYKVTYNILRPVIVKSYNPSLFIKEISGDRTEIRLSTNNISNNDIVTNTAEFINNFQAVPYFKEFYLNFGKNQLYPAVNVALDLGSSTLEVTGSLDNNTVTSTLSGNPTVLIKLLNPLPVKYKVNDLLNVVDEIGNPQVFEAILVPDVIPVIYPTLRGPNFDLDLDNVRVGPTPYYNFTQVTSFQGNFAPQLQQLLGQLSASNFQINVDYTNYENFVHFSSAARRLEGFRYKLINIEATSSFSASAAASSSPSSNIDTQNYQSSINKIIQSFDGLEQYLYYESSSYTWPKQNSDKPYIVYSVTASEAVNWFNGNYDSASLYDDNNQNYMLYTLPGYIAENTSNELAFEFVASIGQMFDDVWIHIKAISDLYQAKNALDQGISKDLVYFALQSMGINTYTDEDGTNQFQYLYGVDENGSYLPNTGSYDTLISASNYQIPGQDQQKEIYKRLYHNLPLLLKSKGTTRFVQYLNTIFGIPSTVMSYIEYGGVDKVTSSFEYEYDRFTYALDTFGSGNINVPWTFLSQSLNKTGNNDIVTNGIEFRFKAVPSSSVHNIMTYPTQSLLTLPSNFQLNLIYTQTGSNNSIYSGSVGNFGYFKFDIGASSVTSSTVPIFTTGSDGQTSWYNILLQRKYPNVQLTDDSLPQIYELYIKNNVHGEIGHVASASLNTSIDNYSWYYPGGNLILGYQSTGSFQEFRLWSNYISESVFDSHVLNPESIEGNFITSSFEDLAARFTLGNNLYTYNHNVTTQTYSTHPDQKTQILTASFIGFPNQNNYISFTETYYADVANSGYANPVTDKIRIVSSSIYGNQLMPNKSIEVQPNIPLTKDIHLLDASLSPQDEIDRAIIAQFGSTYNLDDIIGNPDANSYNELQSLQADFFKKFISKYDYKDYIRLISFFHNSLFRTLKDFTPARTNLSTGIVIKPHLLERSVVARPEPYVTPIQESGSIDTAFISGSNGGEYSQSLYLDTIHGNMGPVTMNSDARDFFTGVFPSSSVIAYSNEFQYNPFCYYLPNHTSSYSESIWYHDYYPLINNVSSSRLSKERQKITYITSASKLTEVLEPVSLQDGYYQYERHKRPRYDGSTVTSNLYNFFSDKDFDFVGKHIGSYGKNASIDKNTIRFAYVNEATCTGSFSIAMPERTNLYIKYLIDETGSLTELAQRNYDNIDSNQFYNLYQVQNIFKQSEQANVSLFDNQNPSLQKTLDGNKPIFSSGYKYYPVLWRIAETTQAYNLQSGSAPNNAALSPTNYNVATPSVNRVDYLFKADKTIIQGTVNYTPAILLPYDVIVTIEFSLSKASLLTFYGNKTITTDVLIPSLKNGVANFTGAYRTETSGLFNVSYFKVINVKPASGAVSGLSYRIEDTAAYLNVHSQSVAGTYRPTDIVSCSLYISKYYNESFYFSGSLQTAYAEVNNIINTYSSYSISEYPFSINPGDVIRFDYTGSASPTTFFKNVNEYTILEVYTASLPNQLAFKVDRTISDAVTSSVTPWTIERYVFSRRIADETNIIIEHQKNPGKTSGGVVKNVNLSLVIDAKVANIVSELKSKIFSTVITT